MRIQNRSIHILIWCLIIAASPLFGAVKLQVRDGRPIVDGVFVNGNGPYRFLVDTGTNVNLIDATLARKIGMIATFQVDLGSAAGRTSVGGSDGNEISIEAVRAGGQKFLYSELEAIHRSSPDIQGVLGEWFLAQFDYTLDLQGRRLEFGSSDPGGARIPFKMVNARPVVSTSLGELALDSGQANVVLFGRQPDDRSEVQAELHTIAGSTHVGMVSGRPLTIQGHKVWSGDAVAIPSRPEPGVDGLLPLNLFKAVFVCNSGGYVVFE